MELVAHTRNFKEEITVLKRTEVVVLILWPKCYLPVAEDADTVLAAQETLVAQEALAEVVLEVAEEDAAETKTKTRTRTRTRTKTRTRTRTKTKTNGKFIHLVYLMC